MEKCVISIELETLGMFVPFRQWILQCSFLSRVTPSNASQLIHAKSLFLFKHNGPNIPLRIHWDGNIAILTKSSPLVGTEFVILQLPWQLVRRFLQIDDISLSILGILFHILLYYLHFDRIRTFMDAALVAPMCFTLTWRPTIKQMVFIEAILLLSSITRTQVLKVKNVMKISSYSTQM